MTTNLTIFIFLGVTLRDPGITNASLVDCTLRDLVPDVGGCVL